jgi:hypothetical protein
MLLVSYSCNHHSCLGARTLYHRSTVEEGGAAPRDACWRVRGMLGSDSNIG